MNRNVVDEHRQICQCRRGVPTISPDPWRIEIFCIRRSKHDTEGRIRMCANQCRDAGGGAVIKRIQCDSRGRITKRLNGQVQRYGIRGPTDRADIRCAARTRPTGKNHGFIDEKSTTRSRDRDTRNRTRRGAADVCGGPIATTRTDALTECNDIIHRIAGACGTNRDARHNR